MKTSELDGAELDYWVARGLHDFIREIHFTDGGQTLAIRGNDRGRAWDGRFLPSTSWEAASVVLERACRLEMNDHGRGEVVCKAVFGSAGAGVEGRGPSLRIALLRAFVQHAFGEHVDDEFPRRSQLLLGGRAQTFGEGNGEGSTADAPAPDGRIGDIGSAARQ
jgi:Protein of unknown function (DUF2591)